MRRRGDGAVMAHSRRRTGRRRPRRAPRLRARRSATAPAADRDALAVPPWRLAATVCGPIAGMSRRKSCPRFGALTNTPAGRKAAGGRACRNAATRASIGVSVPSAASTEERRGPLAMTTPLPGVERRQRGDQRRAMRMSASACGVAARAPIGPKRRQQARRDIVRADHLEAFALENRRDAGEQMVVAARNRQREFRQPLDRPPIEAQVGEFRPVSPPISATSATPWALSVVNSLPSWPMRSHTWANVSISGSAAPAMPTRNGGRPAAAAARATRAEFPAAADDGERARIARLAQASSSRPARGVQTAVSPLSRRRRRPVAPPAGRGGRGDLFDPLL